MNKNLIPFGLNAAGRMVTVDEVARGLACQCRCSCCGAALVACQGDVKTWYFSHASGADCGGAYESSLHQAVKQIIAEDKAVALPRCAVVCQSRQDQAFHDPQSGRTGLYVYHGDDIDFSGLDLDLQMPECGVCIIPARVAKFDSVVLEKTEGDIRPDILATIGTHKLFIEVAVTHFVDAAKMQKIQARGVSTLEIDLSGMYRENWTWEDLRKLVRDPANKRWLLNARAEVEAKLDRDARVKRVAEHVELVRQRDAAALADKERHDEYIRYNFAPSHTLVFSFGRTRIDMQLCRRHVSIQTWPVFENKLKPIFSKIAALHKGNFANHEAKWIFPSDIQVFYDVAWELNQAGCRVSAFTFPKDTDAALLPGFLHPIYTVVRDRMDRK